MNKKVILINILVIILIVIGFEQFLRLRSEKKDHEIVRIRDKGAFKRHKILAYVPGKKSVRDQYLKDGQPIYDVHYTLNEHNWRRTNKGKKFPSDECIIFVGGSYTFGEGLHDEQTVAYLISEKLNVETHNLSMMGYGPNQLLAMFEYGVVDDVVNCNVRYVIYPMIMEHVKRVVNKVSWKSRGPQYILDENHHLKHIGQFSLDDPHHSLRKSYLYRQFTKHKTSKKDVKLTLAIIDRLAKITKDKYPNSEFHVVFWNEHYYSFHDVVRKHLQKHYATHLISDIVPHMFEKLPEHVILAPYNYHPTAEVNQYIADYLEEVLKIDSHEESR